MTEPPVPAELLSAYVDDETTPDETARIRRMALSDPGLARRIAVLRSLRLGVAAIGADAPAVPIQRPEPVSGRGTGRGGVGWVLTGIAVALVIALVGVRVLPLWVPGGSETAAVHASSDLKRMIAAYDSQGQTQASGAVPAGAEDARLSALIGTAELRFTGASVIDLGAGRVAREEDYLGPKGCRLGLFRLPAPAQGAAGPGLTIEATGNLQIASWTADLQYVMISRRMDTARFAMIAGSLSTATGRSGTSDSDLMAVLSVAHQHCVG